MSYIFKKFSIKHWVLLVVIFALSFAQVFFTMKFVGGVSDITKTILSSGPLSGKDSSLIWKQGTWLIIYGVSIAVSQIVRTVVSSYEASDIVSKLRGELFDKIDTFTTADLAHFSTESLIVRTTNDIQNIHAALLQAFKTIFIAPITMVWAIIEISKISSLPLTVTTIIWLVFLVIFVSLLMFVVVPRFGIIQKLTDKISISSRENLTGVRVIRVFNSEDYQQNKFDVLNNEFARVSTFVGKAIALFMPTIMLIMMGLNLSLLWVTAYVINGQNIDLANQVFASSNSFMMLASQIIDSIIVIIVILILVPRAIVCSKRVKEVMEYDELIKDPAESLPFINEGTIEFKDVGFTFKGVEKEIISHASFKVEKGETIAFIGPTGCGKTSIINLIMRFVDATSGEVLVNGVNVKNVHQKQLRSVIGYASQKAFLFSGTIRSNLIYSNPNLTFEDIKKACVVADADGFINEKEGGYDAKVAQGGSNFSGGQKQRLCIARAVASKPQILIFDDSFSALDYRTDKLVRDNINEYLPNTTKIIVAQRVGTIMNADKIVVLEHGKIVDIGNHESLLNKCDLYREIALSQLTSEELGLKKGGK